MNFSISTCILAILFVARLECQAKAEVVLAFGSPSGALQNSFNVDSNGSKIDVSVYLLDSNPLMSPLQEGLFSAGFRLNFTAGNTSIELPTPTNIAINPAFDFSSNPIVSANSVSFDLATLDLDLGKNNPQLLLATITFTGKTQGLSQLSLADLNSNTNWLTFSNTEFDGFVGFSRIATLNVVAVPEPSSILLILLAAPALLFRRRLRQNSAEILRVD